MKNTTAISALLGLSQQDMANLLGVSRSLFSMFESGKRDLPPNATQLLAEILAQVRPAITPTKGLGQTPHRAQRKLQIERLLRENEYQQLLNAKKIATATKRYESHLRASSLAESLKSYPNKKVKTELLQAAVVKISDGTATDSLEVLVRYEIKQELLLHEQKWLESQL